MVGRELWINSAYFSERAENKRIDGTQTATWRVVLSEGVMTARLFFTFSAVVKIVELHNKSPLDVLHFKKITKWRTFLCQNGEKSAYRIIIKRLSGRKSMPMSPGGL